MKIKNEQIFKYAEGLASGFNPEVKIPVKINFFIQKNKNIIMELASEIEKARMEILSEYGTIENEKINIPNEKMPEVLKELNELFNIEQEVNIHFIKLLDFDNIELTMEEMSAIMFMIEE